MPANIVATVYIHIALIFGAAVAFFSFNKKEVLHCLVIWSLITATGFLSGHFWVLALIIFSGAIYLLKNHRMNILVYYFMALSVLPVYMNYGIPSPFPGTKYLLVVCYFRLLSICLMLPLFFIFIQDCYFSKIKNFESSRFFESFTDLLIFSYSILLFFLAFRNEPSLTSAIKNTFYISLMITIPYFVISRSIKTENEFIKILTAILWVAIILSFIAYIQAGLDWNIYNILHYNIGMEADHLVFGKEYRGGFMRVEGTMGHPIAFGYFMTLAMGLLLLLKKLNRVDIVPYAVILFTFIGVIFLTGSRAAWACSCFIIICFWFFSKSNYRFLGIYFTSGLLCLISAGGIIKKLLPVVDPYGTFNYRISLIQNSLAVIHSHPWFGSSNFRQTQEMEAMRQGQGIIDIVNSYIQIALSSGVIGLSLFILIFMVLIYKIINHLTKSCTKNRDENFYVGVYLLSALITTMIYISTTSSLGNIAIYYWSLIGLSSAYLRLTMNKYVKTK